MKNRSRFAIPLLIASVLLSACVPTAYRVGDATYSNRDEAWAAVLRRDAETEASISSSDTPLSQKKLLVVIPTAASMLKFFEANASANQQTFPSPGTPAHAQLAFAADMSSQNLKSITSSIRRSSIYREVSILDANSTTENIQPTSEADVLVPTFVPGGGGQTWYYSSAKDGKQVLPVDMSHKEIVNRRKSLIDALKAKALQQ